jgi:hypothetical protein
LAAVIVWIVRISQANPYKPAHTPSEGPSFQLGVERKLEGHLTLTEARCKAAMPKIWTDGPLKPNLSHDGNGLYLQVSPGANGTVNKSWLYRYSIALFMLLK